MNGCAAGCGPTSPGALIPSDLALVLVLHKGKEGVILIEAQHSRSVTNLVT